MTKLDKRTIASRSIRSILALTTTQIINTLLIFLLTIFIDPRTFGVYVVVSASLAFFSYFSDIGLAAALVQKKDKLTREDLSTTFTIQQILVILVIIIGFLAVPYVATFYDLDKQGIQLFQALVISFFFSSLKTIPSIILERRLEFQKVVIPQIIEALVFNIVAILFFLKGLGITSFSFAVVARGIVGVLAIYLIAPWRITIGVSLTSARKLLSYGVPFQTNSILALIKDDFLIILLGKILSLTEIGFIGFAQKWAFLPLRLVMDKLIRVTFPAFSRLQEDSKALSLAIEKTIFAISFLIIPSVLGLVTLAPYAFQVIPQYRKWEPALFLVVLFAINALFSSISTPLTNVLNALGKIKTTLRLMVFWTASTWVLTFLFIRFFGFVGVALASAIIATSAVFVVYLVRREVKFEILRPIIKPFISGIVMATVLYLTAPLFIVNLLTLLLGIAGGAMIYFALILLLAKKEIIADLKTILKHLK